MLRLVLTLACDLQKLTGSGKGRASGAVLREGLMEFVNRIQGRKTVSVFEDLRTQRSPMRFHVLGRGYERLTIVTGLESRDGRMFILIDLPNHFENDVPDWAGERVQLEFTDKDRIPHSCRTQIDHLDGDDLWLVFPPHINRMQRRRYFRVEPPAGTRLSFSFQGFSMEAPVLNISMGGAFVNSPDKLDTRAVTLQAGMSLYDLLLVGAMAEEKVEVRIKRAEVVRVEKIPEHSRINSAVQFFRMDRTDEALLERFIYHSQRAFLRKRSLLAGT